MGETLGFTSIALGAAPAAMAGIGFATEAVTSIPIVGTPILYGAAGYGLYQSGMEAYSIYDAHQSGAIDGISVFHMAGTTFGPMAGLAVGGFAAKSAFTWGQYYGSKIETAFSRPFGKWVSAGRSGGAYWESSASSTEVPLLWTYSTKPFRGSVLHGKGGGRPFASTHAPGEWNKSWLPHHVAKRMWRIGHIRPRPHSLQLSSSETANFIPVSRITPTGFLFKQRMGQYALRGPGSVEFMTGNVLPATPMQNMRYYGNLYGEWIFVVTVTSASLEYFSR